MLQTPNPGTFFALNYNCSVLPPMIEEWLER
jgi:hypothetical protein